MDFNGTGWLLMVTMDNKGQYVELMIWLFCVG